MDAFLKQVPLFADLSDEDLDQLCLLAEDVYLSPGEELFAQGARGDRAYVIKEGQLEIIKSSAGREVLLAVRGRGEVIGEMSMLEEQPRMASGRARTDMVLLAIHHEQLSHLLNTSPTAAHAMLQSVLSRYRENELALRQSEKMAQLGTLTAGIAHELNNPSAAVKRSAEQLLDGIMQAARTYENLNKLSLDDAQLATLQTLLRKARRKAANPSMLDAIDRSDRQSECELWLDDQGVEDSWEIAPMLVDIGFDVDGLAALRKSFTSDQLHVVIGWVGAIFNVFSLLTEIGHGATQISQIVKALKSYTFLDQAPVQSVDIHEGLDYTLIMLKHKLKKGINVKREYVEDLPKIQAHGSELNQVWTNIIDNAADALNGEGEIIIRTRHGNGFVYVDIEDNGPGIPEEIQPRVFEAFFTTKAPGEGTGMGLDISYKIIAQQHRGDIKIFSKPGKTRFEVQLPINFEDK